MKRLKHKVDARLSITKSVFKTLSKFYLFHGYFKDEKSTGNTSKVLQQITLQIDGQAFDHDKQSLLLTIWYSKQICWIWELYYNQTSRVVQHQNIGYIFMTVFHFNLSQLTRYQFTEVLSKAIKHLQPPNSSGYKSHSFPVGACTDLAVRGISYKSYICN